MGVDDKLETLKIRKGGERGEERSTLRDTRLKHSALVGASRASTEDSYPRSIACVYASGSGFDCFLILLIRFNAADVIFSFAGNDARRSPA